MATFYLKSGAGAIELANRAWSLTEKMVPAYADATTNFAVARRWVWEVTTAGTSTGTPTWAASVTQDVTTVTQNGVVWTARKPGFSSGTTANWAFAGIYLEYLAGAVTAIGDTIYVSNHHAEAPAATISVTFTNFADLQIICVDDAAAPPTATATTATISTTGTFSINMNPRAGTYFYGIGFIAGVTSGSTTNVSGPAFTFEKCSLQISSTGGSSTISIGGARLINTDVKFAAAGQSIVANAANAAMWWTGGSLLSGGTSPTALFTVLATGSLMEDFDLTNASAGVNLCAISAGANGGDFRNIRLPGSWSGSVNSSTPSAIPNAALRHNVYQLMNADSTGTNYVLQRKNSVGTVTQDTSIYRTGGSNNGVTAMSWKVVTTSSAGKFPQTSCTTPEIVKWFPITGFSTGSPVNVTLCFIHDSLTALNNDEIWAEASYLGTSGAPLGTLITNAKADVLASAGAQPSDSSTWTGTGGFSNPNKQKLVLTFTPQLAGIIHITVKVCKATKTLYLDPLVTFS